MDKAARNLCPRALPALIALLLSIVCPALAGDAEAGREAFLKHCRTCHGEDGKGKPAIARMYKVELKEMGSAYVQGKSDEELTRIITEGKGKMTAVKRITPEEIPDVIAHLRTLAEKNDAEGPSDDASR